MTKPRLFPGTTSYDVGRLRLDRGSVRDRFDWTRGRLLGDAHRIRRSAYLTRKFGSACPFHLLIPPNVQVAITALGRRSWCAFSPRGSTSAYWWKSFRSYGRCGDCGHRRARYRRRCGRRSPFPVVAAIGVVSFLATFVRWIRSAALWRSLVLVVGALAFSVWTSGVVWGRNYKNPLFYETISSMGRFTTTACISPRSATCFAPTRRKHGYRWTELRSVPLGHAVAVWAVVEPS